MSALLRPLLVTRRREVAHHCLKHPKRLKVTLEIEETDNLRKDVPLSLDDLIDLVDLVDPELFDEGQAL